MSLRHDLVIDPQNPFANDKLKREEEAKTLTKLVRNYADGFVLRLNNEWVAGKTTFVKMWQAHSALEGIQSLNFNDWESMSGRNGLAMVVDPPLIFATM